MIQYIEERRIQAPDHKVFDVISDFNNYQNWNQWIHFAKQNLDGTVTVRTTIKGKEKTFQHKMIESVSPHTFHWCDMGWFTKLAFGQRIRKITHLSESECLYRCELRVEGIAEKLADKSHGNFMRAGMLAEADSLKIYVESLC